MRKKYIGWMLALPALLGFGMTSCSNEDMVAVQETANKRTVTVKIKASLEDATRAILVPNEENGLKTLKFEWELNDRIKVVDKKNNEYVGYLKVSHIDETTPSICEFEGSLTLPVGNVSLGFYYLGENINMSWDDQYKVNNTYIDFSNQTGALDFSDTDVMIASGDFTDKQVNENEMGTLNFKRYFAHGRFVLKYNDEEIDVKGKTVTISANTGTFYNGTALDFAKAEYEPIEGTINVNIPEDAKANSFYVSLVPSESVSLKFTVDMGDGNIFVGSKGNGLKVNSYYSSSGDPIIVEMKNTDGSDDSHHYMFYYYAIDRNQNAWVYNLHDEIKIGLQYDKPVLSIDEAMPDYNYDKERFEFSHWSLNYDNPEPKYEVGSTYHFDFNDPSTGTISGDMIYIPLYASVKYIYTMEFILDDDVVLTGTETLNRTYKTYDIEWNPTILEEGVTISKPGYELESWETILTNGVYDPAQGFVPAWLNKAYLSPYMWKKVFKPVWKKVEKAPNTISTSGYGHGSFNQ